MAKHHKPREGSTGFWHRARARRIYQRMNTLPAVKEAVPLVFAGYKAGMTSVSYLNPKKGSQTENQEVMKAATILDCPPLHVCGIKVYNTTPYGAKAVGEAWAEKLPKEVSRKTSVSEGKKHSADKLGKDIGEKSFVRMIVCTNPKNSGLGKKRPEVFEVHVGGDAKAAFEFAKSKLGSELRASDVLKQGEMVDAVAVTKGKGYQGPVKRFGIKVRSRKNKGKMRHVGNLGPQNPPKVIPSKIPEAGQMGFHNRTEYNKKILRIASGGISPRGGFVSYGVVPGEYIIIEGSLPGPKKRLIMLRPAMRKGRYNDNPVELKHVSLEPQN